MALPVLLEQKLNSCLIKLKTDLKQELKPFERLSIYEAFGSEDDAFTQKVHANLQVITAQWILPFCEEIIDVDLQIDILKLSINLAEYMINELIGWETNIYSLITKKLDQLSEKYQTSSNNTILYDRFFFILSLARHILYTKGIKPFKNIGTSNGTFYSTMDHSDETLYLGIGGDLATTALIIYAGSFENGVWKNKFNPQKRLEFWEWWLTKAIPQTWEKTTKKVDQPVPIDIIQKNLLSTNLSNWVNTPDYFPGEGEMASNDDYMIMVFKEHGQSTFQAMVQTLPLKTEVKNKVVEYKVGFTTAEEAKIWCKEFLDNYLHL